MAAIPVEKATVVKPFSICVILCSKAVAVGFPCLEYAYPFFCFEKHLQACLHLQNPRLQKYALAGAERQIRVVINDQNVR